MLRKLSKFYVSIAKSVKLSHIYIKGDNPGAQTNLMIFHGMSIVTSVKSRINSAYLLDLRNHGESEHSATMSYEECAMDIKNFIDSHQLKNVCLMGHSFGGRVIMGYLQHHLAHAKEKLKAVVIVDISPRHISDFNVDKIYNLLTVTLKQRHYNELIQDIEYICNDKAMSNLMIQNLKCEDQLVNRNTRQNFYWRMNLQAIADNIEEILQTQIKAEWTGPVYVICGECSTFVNKEEINDFLEVFPNINLKKDIVFVDNAGHYVHVEQAYEFKKLLFRFLSEINK